jgi:hypothetical protein
MFCPSDDIGSQQWGDLLSHKNGGWVFAQHVDPDELCLPIYFDVIKNPMDFGTMQQRIKGGLYKAIKEAVVHIKLTFDAMLFNEKGLVVHEWIWGQCSNVSKVGCIKLSRKQLLISISLLTMPCCLMRKGVLVMSDFITHMKGYEKSHIMKPVSTKERVFNTLSPH